MANASPRKERQEATDERPRRERGIGHALERMAGAVLGWTGTSTAFLLALGLIAVWIASGPLFHFSDTWQLVINTTTTIVTFLMVFLIQRAQNKDARAVALKLDELIAALEGASNRLIDVESLSEDELETIRRHYQRLVIMAKKDDTIRRSHSIDEAAARHERKTKRHASRK